MGSASLKKSSRRSSVRAKLLLKKNTSSGSVSDATASGKNWSGAVSGHWSFWKKIHVEQFRAKFLQKMPQSRLLQGSGVRRLKFFTPTPLLLSVNILRLRTNSKTFVSFALRLLFKLEIEWYKPRRKCSKITLAPLRLFVKKNNSGSTPSFEIHQDSGRSLLLLLYTTGSSPYLLKTSKWNSFNT